MAFLMMTTLVVMTRSSPGFSPIHAHVLSKFLGVPIKSPVITEDQIALAGMHLIFRDQMRQIMSAGHTTGKILAESLDKDQHSIPIHPYSYPSSSYPSTSYSVPDVHVNSKGVQHHVKEDKPLIETLYTYLIK